MGAGFILALILGPTPSDYSPEIKEKALGVGPLATDTSYADGMPIFLLANRGGNAR